MTTGVTIAPDALRLQRRWTLVGALGEILITIGVVLMLFVVHELWWTNVEASRAADQVAAELRQDWGEPIPAEPSPNTGALPEPAFGQGLALMYFPRLKDEVWGLPVLGSISIDDLARGIGHYPDSALPGEAGNFAVAGHRATHGEPLRRIDQVQQGDEVYLETRDSWYVYRLTKTTIVAPSDTWVVDPVPGEASAKPTQRLITITTCHPRWASTQRWIWWGEQIQEIDKSTNHAPEAILAAG